VDEDQKLCCKIQIRNKQVRKCIRGVTLPALFALLTPDFQSLKALTQLGEALR
jgi:hypothetical protein